MCNFQNQVVGVKTDYNIWARGAGEGGIYEITLCHAREIHLCSKSSRKLTGGSESQADCKIWEGEAGQGRGEVGIDGIMYCHWRHNYLQNLKLISLGDGGQILITRLH